MSEKWDNLCSILNLNPEKLHSNAIAFFNKRMTFLPEDIPYDDILFEYIIHIEKNRPVQHFLSPMALKIDVPLGTDRQDAVIYLYTVSRQTGCRTECDFNGKTLYSKDSLSDTFVAAFGMTHMEKVTKEIDWRQKVKEEKRQWEEEKPRLAAHLMMEAYPYICDREKFLEALMEDVNGMYRGGITSQAIEVMEQLDLAAKNGASHDHLLFLMEGLLDLQDHSGNTYNWTKSMVMRFSAALNGEVNVLS